MLYGLTNAVLGGLDRVKVQSITEDYESGSITVRVKYGTEDADGNFVPSDSKAASYVTALSIGDRDTFNDWLKANTQAPDGVVEAGNYRRTDVLDYLDEKGKF